MKLFKILLLLVVFSSICQAQSQYPQDYFRNPLDIPLVLSGTFGELRSNHFHSGLDIKTQQVTGKKVYASAKGYVSRIKISHWGYGKAIYVTHPNGYTTVYGHLKNFSERIETFVKKKQYEKENFQIELFPKASELIINTDEIIGYSGNTGGSGGPHLHFEIRDNKERPMNPMLFGIDVKDTRKPNVKAIYAYPIDAGSHVNQSTERVKLRLIPEANGDYTVEKIEAFGRVGFGVNTSDRQDLASNNNGVFNIQTFLNGNKNFELAFNRFSFSESKHLNRLIDYTYFKKNKSRIQKLFVESNNPLSMYKDVNDSGYITVLDSMSSIYRIKIIDFKGNEAWVTIPINGKIEANLEANFLEATNYFVVHDEPKTFSKDNVSLSIPANTFYDDTYLDFDVIGDTLKIHQPTIPVNKSFTITYDISNYTERDKDKLFIANITEYYKKRYVNYTSTRKKGNTLTARTKTLGKYTLASDTIEPTITPINFSNNKWLSKYRFLKVKLKDDLSGIKNYRATVNGKWILMEFDAKKSILTHDFNDNVVTDTKNNLKIIVTDNVGNSTTFEATFFRK